MTVETKQKKNTNSSRYTEGIGRRKTSVARVRVVPSSNTVISVNKSDLEQYFKNKSHQKKVKSPFEVIDDAFTVDARVTGGGLTSQADAVCLGIARAVVKHKQEHRKLLKQNSLLRRDPRRKERKKYGLKKARRAPQWSKR
ncbi:MAG: 30S ribosomal protein S9 [Candidatus Campbellbacteria bacterium]|nr:30S ribosomal protein S9 [Candidatus Campbellbacteria bacterium]